MFIPILIWSDFLCNFLVQKGICSHCKKDKTHIEMPIQGPMLSKLRADSTLYLVLGHTADLAVNRLRGIGMPSPQQSLDCAGRETSTRAI
jgi:hypothetical protein